MLTSPYSASQETPFNFPPKHSIVFGPEANSSECNQLPPSPVSRVQIDYCKAILTKEKHAIGYRDVLEKISEQSWLIRASSPEGTEVTRELIALQPALLEEYNQRASSESAWDRIMARVPLLSRALSSTRFLESLASANDIIRELESHGLITVRSVAPDVTLGGKPDGLIQVGFRAISISVTEWGKLILAT